MSRLVRMVVALAMVFSHGLVLLIVLEALSALIGTSGAFVANSVSFLLSSLLLLGLPRGISRGGAEKQDRRLLAALADPGLRLSVLLSAVWPLARGALSVLITAYSFDTFHAGGCDPRGSHRFPLRWKAFVTCW